MDFNLENIIYLNLNSKPDSFDQYVKIAECFHFDFSCIQKALDLNYSRYKSTKDSNPYFKKS